MKTTSKTKTAEAKATAPTIVLPATFAPLKGMNDITLAAAVSIAEKNPQIVTAIVDLRDAMGRAGEKFFGVASTLRAAKLVKKEATMLLHAMGLSPSRTSEMIRLSSVSEKIWKQYSAQSVGFRAALQLDNGDKGKTKKENSTGGKKHKVHAVNAHVADVLAQLAKLQDGLPMLDGQRTEYSHTVELGEGRFVFISLFSDKE